MEMDRPVVLNDPDGFGLRMPERYEEETDEKRLERTAVKIRKFIER